MDATANATAPPPSPSSASSESKHPLDYAYSGPGSRIAAADLADLFEGRIQAPSPPAVITTLILDGCIVVPDEVLKRIDQSAGYEKAYVDESLYETIARSVASYTADSPIPPVEFIRKRIVHSRAWTAVDPNTEEYVMYVHVFVFMTEHCLDFSVDYEAFSEYRLQDLVNDVLLDDEQDPVADKVVLRAIREIFCNKKRPDMLFAAKLPDPILSFSDCRALFGPKGPLRRPNKTVNRKTKRSGAHALRNIVKARRLLEQAQVSLNAMEALDHDQALALTRSAEETATEAERALLDAYYASCRAPKNVE